MTGRIESYLHSDSTTPNKGGAIVKVNSETDFAAKTSEFIAFARLVANRAYGASAEFWQDIVNVFPEMETERANLSKLLKEDITITDIVIMKL